VKILTKEKKNIKKLVRQPGKKPHAETDFSITTPRTTGCWESHLYVHEVQEFGKNGPEPN
jgi:hypothetical protein